ncbi:serine hydrolase domain-containing protein [Chitinophaga pollutisoli]|uniref:Serine hydrolase domain-containing protein n=1 Tax=Chitinophaga pollutisoli TaxID=3133966 RepID=A0ABZ2YHV5_9BACT
MLRKISLSLSALLVLSGAQAQTWQDTLARIESAFERFKPDGPGAQMAISRNGKVIFSKSWGMADLERNVPMATTSLIEAGSVSKQFTAASILILEQQGKLSVADEVRKYVPELPEYGHPVRVSHLLHHSSGLKDWGSVAELTGWPRGERNYTNDDALRIICRQKSLNNPPGYEYIYSNTNYTLMTIIVERVSGKTLEEFTDEHIFTPAGMNASHWRQDHRQLVPHRAIAYGKDDRYGYHINMPNESVYGHAALLTTAEELLKWNDLYTSGRYGSPSLYPKQTETVPLTCGHPAMYAAGLMTAPINGRKAVTHSGATAGYRANLEYFPELGMSFAYLCNTSQFDRAATNAAAVVRNIFIPEPPKTPAPQTAVPAIAVPPEALRAFTGWYRNVRSDDGIKITESNGNLYEGTKKLHPAGGATFRNEGGMRYAFSKTDLFLITPQQDTFAFKPENYPDTAASNAEYAGEYVSSDAEARWKVTLDGKNLVVNIDRPGFKSPLQPLYKDAFQSYFGLVRFRRDAQNRVTGLEITSGRARRVPFTRAN